MKPGIRITRRYPAPPERVFGAWLDPEVAAQWLFATASRPMARATIDARVGGSFCFAERREGVETEYSGRYVEIVPPRRLVFTLSAHEALPGATRVIVEFVPVTAGCRVSLTHEIVPPERARRTAARWTGVLYGLGVTLEAGLKARSPEASHSRIAPLSNSRIAERL